MCLLSRWRQRQCYNESPFAAGQPRGGKHLQEHARQAAGEAAGLAFYHLAAQGECNCQLEVEVASSSNCSLHVGLS